MLFFLRYNALHIRPITTVAVKARALNNMRSCTYKMKLIIKPAMPNKIIFSSRFIYIRPYKSQSLFAIESLKSPLLDILFCLSPRLEG